MTQSSAEERRNASRWTSLIGDAVRIGPLMSTAVPEDPVAVGLFPISKFTPVLVVKGIGAPSVRTFLTVHTAMGAKSAENAHDAARMRSPRTTNTTHATTASPVKASVGTESESRDATSPRMR